jgi:D-cysteine desulfhydrase
MAALRKRSTDKLRSDSRRNTGYVHSDNRRQRPASTGRSDCHECGRSFGASVHGSGSGGGARTSAGTHAGLVVGFVGCSMNLPIVGVGVSREPGDQEPIVYDLALKTAERLGVTQQIPRSAVVSFGGYWQPKYSVPNKKMVAAVNLMAKTEGILLDPVYTGKAVAGLIGLSRNGYFKKGENLLFVHPGGSPGLFAYIKPVLGLEPVAD